VFYNVFNVMLSRRVFLGWISCWEWRHASPTTLFQTGNMVVIVVCVHT